MYHISIIYLLSINYLIYDVSISIYHQSVIYLSVIITYLLSIINLPLVPFLWRTLTNAVTDPPLDKTVDPGCGRGQQQASLHPALRSLGQGRLGPHCAGPPTSSSPELRARCLCCPHISFLWAASL